MTAEAPSYNDIAARRLDRIAALSDGLFAIAMTLIVLEIRAPEAVEIHSEGDLLGALVGLFPQLVTYLLSFLTLGIFWSAQQTQLNNFDHADRNLTWIHITFLASVALMPFSTGLLSVFITYRVALIVYWLNILLCGIVLYASWWYAERAGLLKAEVTPAVSLAVKRRIVIAQGLYAVGALLCVIDTSWSIAFIVLVQLNFAIAPRLPGLRRL